MSSNTRRCSGCGRDAQFVYTAEFRVGGTSGGVKLLIGEWGELGERMIPMYVFVSHTAVKWSCMQPRI
jgi:hypothetical protein